MGKSSGGSQPQTVQTTTTQQSDPWSGVQPHLEYGFEQARDWYDSDQPTYYPNATYTDMAPQTELGLGLMENRALSGSPITDQASQQYMNTLSGANLYNNPGFNLMSPFATGQFSTPGTDMIAYGGMGANGADQYLQGTAAGDYLNQDNPGLAAVGQRLQNQIQPMVDSRFASSGRTGSGAHEESFTRSMADAMAPYMYGNYESERGRQLQAAGMLQGSGENAYGRMMGAGGQLAGIGAGERQTQLGAAGALSNLYSNAQGQQYNAMMGAPGYAQQDYNDYNRLMGVGDAYRGQEGQVLGDSIARHDYFTNQPYTDLAQYMGLLSGTYGGTTTSTGDQLNPNYGTDPSLGQNLLGLAATGVGAYFGGPWGAAAAGSMFG